MEEQLRPQSALYIEMVDIEQDKDQSVELETTKKKNESSTKQNMFKSFNSFLHSLKEDRERETTPVEKPQSALYIEMVDIEQDKDQSVELETTKKKNESSTKQNMFKSFNSFLHSLKELIVAQQIKIVWLLMFTSCFIYCGFLIWRSYTKWIKSPAIVMLTENDQPIQYIPFPAVTVCPERKIVSAVFSFDDYINKNNNSSLTEKEQNMFEDVSLICNYNRVSGNERYFSAGNETVGNIRKVSAELSQIMSFCAWKGKPRSCNNIFTPILTEEGVCFTFNTIGPEDLLQLKNLNSDYEYMENLNRTRNQGWSLEDGYPPDAPRKTYPMRGSGAGAKAGLELWLTEMEEGLDLDCKGMLSGFKILVHYAGDLPRPSQQYIRVPIYEEVTVTFTASLEVTSDGLEVFTPIGRQCYFADERSLKYFKLYTQSNCEYECLTNFTYARCGCVHFSRPHGPDMAICNVGSLECINKAEMELTTIYIEEISGEERGNVTIEEALRIADACACLPACTSITYDTDVTQTQLQGERHSYEFKNNSHGDDLKRSKLSKVLIFFQRPLFDIMKRSELYSTSDILASCGGLLGLFMGFSVINIVEIVYFCIIRICRRRRQAEGCESSKNPTVQQSKDKY